MKPEVKRGFYALLWLVFAMYAASFMGIALGLPRVTGEMVYNEVVRDWWLFFAGVIFHMIGGRRI